MHLTRILALASIPMLQTSLPAAGGFYGDPPDATHPTARSKWRSAAGNELDQLTLRDFELVDSSSMAEVDQDLLWSSAVNWAVARYGAGTTVHSGWYEGSYWSALLKCARPDYAVGATVRPDCTDPSLAAVDRTVNSPQWLTGRRVASRP